MMPDERQLPESPFERARAFAADLAQGVAEGLWGVDIRISDGGVGAKWDSLSYRSSIRRNALQDYITQEWDGNPPHIKLMEVLDYVRFEREGTGVHYILTQKALDLLDAPRFAKVFISYRRSVSSAFALLLRDRLGKEGFDVFVDLQSINPGEKWEQRLQDEIAATDAVVSLVAPGTLGSEYVRKEILWSQEREATDGLPLVPIWHNGYTAANDLTSYPEMANFLNTSNAIIIEKEDVLLYDAAIQRLMQYLKA